MTLPASSGGGVSGAVFAPPPSTVVTESYILLPIPLALDVRDSPLAAALYLLVARAFFVQQEPVPLSASDIQAIDATSDLSRGAILRALDRLIARGWLIAQTRRGQKAAYLPAWGLINGKAHPWMIGEPALGRPRLVRAVRVPRIVLDVCVGRLIPHRQHAALFERYVTRPPLTLRDIGAYALIWAEVGTPTTALVRLGLAGPAGPLPPPSAEVLLARISQLVFLDPAPEPPTLSLRGMRRVGLVPDPVSPNAEPQMLFFVPPDMIGSMIPPVIEGTISDVIGQGEEAHQENLASTSGKAGQEAAPAATAGTQGIRSTRAKQGTPPARGNSRSSGHTPAANTSEQPNPDSAALDTAENLPPAAAAPQPSVEQVLRAHGLFPDVARRYADMSHELVECAYVIAQRLRWVREPVGAMVWLLDQERVAPGWMEERWKHLLPAPEEAYGEDANVSVALVDSSDERAPLYSLLQSDLPAQIRPFIEIGQLTLAEGIASIELPSWFSADERAQVVDALCDAAAQLGIVAALPSSPPSSTCAEAEPPRLVPATRSAAPPPSEPPPDWIDPAVWAELRLVDQAALLGSRWEDGEIVGKGPQVTKLLRTRLAGLVTRLRADALEREMGPALLSSQAHPTCGIVRDAAQVNEHLELSADVKALERADDQVAPGRERPFGNSA